MGACVSKSRVGHGHERSLGLHDSVSIVGANGSLLHVGTGVLRQLNMNWDDYKLSLLSLLHTHDVLRHAVGSAANQLASTSDGASGGSKGCEEEHRTWQAPALVLFEPAACLSNLLAQALHGVMVTPCHWPAHASLTAPAAMLQHLLRGELSLHHPLTASSPGISSIEAALSAIGQPPAPLPGLAAILDACPNILTVCSLDGKQVLYQNARSVTYSGWRGGSASSEHASFMAALFALQPGRVMQGLMLAVGNDRTWSHVIQVPKALAPPPAATAPRQHGGSSEDFLCWQITASSTFSNGGHGITLPPSATPMAVRSTSQDASWHVQPGSATAVGYGASLSASQPASAATQVYGTVQPPVDPASVLLSVCEQSGGDGNYTQPAATASRRSQTRASWLSQTVLLGSQSSSLSAGTRLAPSVSPPVAEQREVPVSLRRSVSLSGPIAEAIQHRVRFLPELEDARGVTAPPARAKTSAGNKVSFDTRHRLLSLLHLGTHRQSPPPSDTQDPEPTLWARNLSSTDPPSAFLLKQPDQDLLAPAADESCWHEVTVCPFLDPATGNKVLLVSQTDVTTQSLVEQQLMNVTEAQLYLLEKMFPRHVLERLAASDVKAKTALGTTGATQQMRDLTQDLTKQATYHECVTIMFTDMVGYTAMSKQVHPERVLTFLNDLFSKFDDLCGKHRVSKIETAGDCYIVCAGLLKEDADGFQAVATGETASSHTHCARRVFNFAVEMLHVAKSVLMPHDQQPVQLRVGIHSGSVVSGLIGHLLPKFSLYGDTMNTASRMESTSLPGRIQISDATLALLNCPDMERWEPTGGVEAKGKGVVETYLFRSSCSEQQDASEQLFGLLSTASPTTRTSRITRMTDVHQSLESQSQSSTASASVLADVALMERALVSEPLDDKPSNASSRIASPRTPGTEGVLTALRARLAVSARCGSRLDEDARFVSNSTGSNLVLPLMPARMLPARSRSTLRLGAAASALEDEGDCCWSPEDLVQSDS